MTRLVVELYNPEQAWLQIKTQVFPFLRQAFNQGGRWVLTVAKRKRSNPQNRRYWGRGVLAQIAEQAVVEGRMFPERIWHEQFKRQFIGVEELPSGEVIGKSSADLSAAEFAEFCTQVEAYAAQELGVRFYDLEAA